MAGLTLSYAVSSFFQVNTDAAEILYQKVIDEAALDASSDVIDLYCGVGALSLLAARKSRYVLGVEEVPSSIRDAKANAAANGLTNVEFIESSVEGLFSEEQKDGWDRYDPSKLTVVVDPPRTGCDPTVMRGLMNVGPRRLVYVSCNPATLARDLSVLAPAYHLQSATPVDLFPHTSHIEVVATMVKKK